MNQKQNEQANQNKKSNSRRLLPSSVFGMFKKTSSRRVNDEIMAQLQEQELEEEQQQQQLRQQEIQGKSNNNASGVRISPPTTSSSSSSAWSETSSSDVEVPYVQVNSPQSSHLPSPEFLLAQQQQDKDHLFVLPSIERQDKHNAPSKHRFQEFITELNQQNGSMTNVLGSSSTKQLQQREYQQRPPPEGERTSRFLEFITEMKELLMDLIEYGKAKTWKKKILTVLLCVSSLMVFYDLIFGHYIVEWLRAFIVWMTTHTNEAVFSFVGIFVLSTLIFIPPTLLVFGAGYAFTVALDNIWYGVAAATLSCFLGSCIGAVIAFLRSRYMMRDLVYLFAKRYPLVRVADRALKTNAGFRIMVLLRLCPLIPFNGLNYICGITGVSLTDFCFSLIGILPFHVYTVILGATAGALELQQLKNPSRNINDNSRQHISFIVLIVTGVLFGLVAMVYAWRLVKMELRRELELSSEEFDSLVHPYGTAASTSMMPFTSSTPPCAITMTTADRTPTVGNSDGGNHEYYLNGIEDGSIEVANSDYFGSKFQEDGEEWYWIWA